MVGVLRGPTSSILNHQAIYLADETGRQKVVRPPPDSRRTDYRIGNTEPVPRGTLEHVVFQLPAVFEGVREQAAWTV